jgi:hypothetical protein
MRSTRRPLLALPLLGALATLAACGNSSGLPTAHIPNEVDTVSLAALDGTPITSPSAYNIQTVPPQRVRTDVTTAWDFAFNLDAAGKAVLLPTGALGLGKQSGVLVSATPFGAIGDAPSNGYDDSTAVQVDSGTVVVIRSRQTTCSFGITVFLYAKLQVLKIDPAARRLDFQILVNQNCGYRNLQPGIPSR